MLGERVKECREKLGLSQNKLAKLSSIPHPTICCIESGKIGQVKSHALRRLAEALGTSTDYLVGRIGIKKKPKKISTLDPNIQYILEKCQHLSFQGRIKLKTFAAFLEAEEKHLLPLDDKEKDEVRQD